MSASDFDLERLVPGAAESAPAAPYLDGLNEAQREAVLTVDGPVLVLAGAGTGKTRALTTRLVHILATGRARPWQVLAVTFTNKAAREMYERVGQVLGPVVENIDWLGTFHAMGARLLRRHAELAGLKPNFTILDADDQLRLLKQLIADANIDEKRWPARGLASLIERWKNRGLAPDQVPPEDAGAYANGRALALYVAYQERLKTLNAADFGDLLLQPLRLLRGHEDLLRRYQEQFRYILVDEYQDTNVAQYLWLRLLAGRHKNICCVGDDDQSIYGWRGAEVGNILRFEQDFDGARIIRLERNYRSTPHILAAASGLIAANRGRLGKTLWTDITEGEKPVVRGVWDGEEEARVIGDEIEALQRQGESLAEMAALVRAGFQTRPIEERLMTLGIPYQVIGGARFYERAEIRDAIAYLRVIAQPDDDLAFERIINTPRRGIGKASLQALHRTARAGNMSLLRAAQVLVTTDELPGRARSALGDLLESFARWRELAEEVPHTELAGIVLDESGYTEMWQNDRSPDAPGRLENLGELVRAMEAFENLAGFLEHVSLVMDVDEAEDTEKVSLMTLHAAKGLEFDTVFLPGWEESLFPHQRALDEGGAAALEEERRLAYVGITRARKRVFITFAANRQVYGQWQSSMPSRFLDELPDEHVERVSAQGVYAGGRDFSAPNHLPFADFNRRRTRRGKGRRAPRLIEATAEVIAEQPIGETSNYRVGERIFHQKFGYGRVAAVDGNKLEIAFEKAGRKRVVDSFVKPA